MISLPDATLLTRTAEGSEEAFEELYRRHQPAVYRYALRMSGSTAVADDVVQEVFMAVIYGARGYDPEAGPLASYLFGIARNKLSRQWRLSPETDELSETAAAPDADPLENLSREESVDQVRQALLGLPAHYREVVVLCELEEMAYADAAEALGLPVGTVRSRLNRARAMLLDRVSRNRVKA